MNNLPIHITAHHLHLSDSLCRFARKKITALRRFANDALGADVVVRRHAGAKKRFSASVRLALPGRDIHARAVASDLHAAIGKLVAKLARLLPEPSDAPGKPHPHEGGQEMRVFHFRRKGAFASSPILIARAIRP